MKIYATKIIFDTDKKEWQIIIKTDLPISVIKAYYNTTINSPLQLINLPFKKNEHGYIFYMKHELLVAKSFSNTKTNWHFVASFEDTHYTISTDGPLQYEQISSPNSLFDYHFEFPEGILTFISEPKKINIWLETFELNNDQISGKIRIESNITLNDLPCNIVLLRRSQPDLYLFHEESLSFPLPNGSEKHIPFSIPTAKILGTLNIDSHNILDVLLEIPTSSNGNRLEYLQISDHLKGKVASKLIFADPTYALLSSYETGSNRLSLTLKKEVEQVAWLTELKEEDETLHLHFSLKKEFSPTEIVLKKQYTKGDFIEYLNEKNWLLKKSWGSFNISIKKEELFAINQSIEENWAFFVRSKNRPDMPIFSQGEHTKFTLREAGHYLKLITDPLKTLMLSCINFPENTSQATSLGLFGSCISLDAFCTNKYYNLDANNFFALKTVTQDSSLISLMSKQIDIPEQSATIPETAKSIIQADLTKNFFTKLQQEKPDFLLIDLAADANWPILWLKEDAAITYNPTFENSMLIEQLPFERMLDHQNNQAYFNVWKSYADQFIATLLEIMPAERIILNRGKLATSYYNKEEKILPFKNAMAIKHTNLLWDQMNNYFEAKIPAIRIVNMSKKNYLASEMHPNQLSPDHYISSYYQDLLKELIYIRESTN